MVTVEHVRVEDQAAYAEARRDDAQRRLDVPVGDAALGGRRAMGGGDLGVRLEDAAHQAVAEGHRVGGGDEDVDEVARRAERGGDGLDVEEDLVAAAVVLGEGQRLEVVDVDEAARSSRGTRGTGRSACR